MVIVWVDQVFHVDRGSSVPFFHGIKCSMVMLGKVSIVTWDWAFHDDFGCFLNCWCIWKGRELWQQSIAWSPRRAFCVWVEVLKYLVSVAGVTLLNIFVGDAQVGSRAECGGRSDVRGSVQFRTAQEVVEMRAVNKGHTRHTNLIRSLLQGW